MQPNTSPSPDAAGNVTPLRPSSARRATGRQRYAYLPQDVLSDPALHPAAKCVYWALAIHKNKAGHCWPSAATLVKMTGLSERGVENALAELGRAGWTTWERDGRVRRFTVYETPTSATSAEVPPAPQAPRDPPTSATSAEMKVALGAQPLHSVPQRLQPVQSNNTKNNPTEHPYGEQHQGPQDSVPIASPPVGATGREGNGRDRRDGAAAVEPVPQSLVTSGQEHEPAVLWGVPHTPEPGISAEPAPQGGDGRSQGTGGANPAAPAVPDRPTAPLTTPTADPLMTLLASALRRPGRPSVLTDEQGQTIWRAAVQDGVPKKALARAYGVAPKTIRDTIEKWNPQLSAAPLAPVSDESASEQPGAVRQATDVTTEIVGDWLRPIPPVRVGSAGDADASGRAGAVAREPVPRALATSAGDEGLLGESGAAVAEPGSPATRSVTSGTATPITSAGSRAAPPKLHDECPGCALTWDLVASGRCAACDAKQRGVWYRCAGCGAPLAPLDVVGTECASCDRYYTVNDLVGLAECPGSPPPTPRVTSPVAPDPDDDDVDLDDVPF